MRNTMTTRALLLILLAGLVLHAAPSPEPAAPSGWERYSAQEGASQESREAYEKGRRELEQEQFAQAVESFAQVARRGDYRPDGALYWQAYALSRQEKVQESLELLRELIETYPQSQWLNEARRLRGDVRGVGRGRGAAVQAVGGYAQGGRAGAVSGRGTGYAVSGSGVYASAGRDELSEKDELRMAILDSLMRSDADKAVPQVEKILSGDASSSVKRRALFVLAQSGHQESGRILAQTARNTQDNSLRYQALQYLGMYGGEEGFQVLEEVYASTDDVRAKREILQSFMMSGRRERLLNLAREEEDPGLRRFAIHQLGVLGAGEELAEMYRQEQEVEVRAGLLEALFVAGQTEVIEQAALEESDAGLRRNAIMRLGSMGGRTETLLQIYRQEESSEVRRSVLQALFISSSDEALIDLAKSESDRGLRRSIIRLLGLMGSEKASDFLIQLLEEKQ